MTGVHSLTAHDLQIAGLTPMSTVDWPGKLVATVFTQGCPWACAYCHNHAILDPRIPGVVAWRNVAELMERRRGLLDAVVFSGGEATRQLALIPAMNQVRQWGFKVGLHTAGPYPGRLQHILRDGLVDWVGLDIKALPGCSYDQVTQRQGSGEKAWESLRVLLDNPPARYEVRLTVDSSQFAQALVVAQRCHEAGVAAFALQEVRSEGTSDEYRRSRNCWEEAVGCGDSDVGQGVRSFAELSAQIEEIGFAEYVSRPAQ